MPGPYFYKEINSPIGKLRLVASDKGLAAILWEKDRLGRVNLEPQLPDNGNMHLAQTEKELGEYFARKRKNFGINLDMKGTDFQKRVWAVLLKIPYGETRSYGQVAQEIQHPKAARAVGAANGRNPVSIIAACHRVIGASGDLTGFAGGLEIKQYLLDLEQSKGESV